MSQVQPPEFCVRSVGPDGGEAGFVNEGVGGGRGELAGDLVP